MYVYSLITQTPYIFMKLYSFFFLLQILNNYLFLYLPSETPHHNLHKSMRSEVPIHTILCFTTEPSYEVNTHSPY